MAPHASIRRVHELVAQHFRSPPTPSHAASVAITFFALRSQAFGFEAPVPSSSPPPLPQTPFLSTAPSPAAIGSLLPSASQFGDGASLFPAPAGGASGSQVAASFLWRASGCRHSHFCPGTRDAEFPLCISSRCRPRRQGLRRLLGHMNWCVLIASACMSIYAFSSPSAIPPHARTQAIACHFMSAASGQPHPLFLSWA